MAKEKIPQTPDENTITANVISDAMSSAIVEEARREGLPLKDALPDIVGSARFTLLGEYHWREFEILKTIVSDIIPNLKEAGLTHLAIEVSSDTQPILDSFDPSMPNAAIELEKLIREAGIKWLNEFDLQMIISAMQENIKVLAIDKPEPGYFDERLNNTAPYQNSRDLHMQQVLDTHTDPDSHVLIYIGSSHVHKSSVESDKESISSHRSVKITRLGALLSRSINDPGAVVSIRALLGGHKISGYYYDNDSYIAPGGSGDVYTDAIIVPEKGIFKGGASTDSDFATLLIPRNKEND